MSSKHVWSWMGVFCVAAAAVALVSGTARAAEKVAEPLGKTLDNWETKGNPDSSNWTIGIAKMDPDNPRQLLVEPATDAERDLVTAKGHGRDIATKEEFGDCTVELEVMVPKGSNSGIYLMGQYEIQVLDSFGRERVGPGDMGGIYGASAPSVNASKAPGEWQRMVIEFKAPRFQDGKKVENARFVKVTLNGQVIHEDVEVKGQTGGAWRSGEFPAGPLMFQGNHGPVAFRNIKIKVSGT
jgi:hypothetical protein